MEDSGPYTKTHSPFPEYRSRIHPRRPIKKGKSCSNFLFKYLFLALLVIVLPLFPSQAPDFVNQTILTKFWELLHLLFVGIAVAYGLFSRRRNAELVETHSESQSSVDSAPSYVSKMFPSSMIYDDGVENPCGYDQNRMMMMHCWNPQGVVCSNVGTVGVLEEQYQTQLPISDNTNFGYSVGCDGNNVVQAWNSEYYHSEPVVVVAAQPHYNTGNCSEGVGYKPLGLPVRSLQSVTREVENCSYTNEGDSSASGSRGSSCESLVKSRDREFGDLSPSNSEKTFNAAAVVGGLASPIPWRSRSRKMERERRHGNFTRPPAQFRPLSVDETKFEVLNSRPVVQSTTTFSSPTSMYSSMESISSDNMKFQEEEMTNKEASYVAASEKMNFQEDDNMGQWKTSYAAPSKSVNFQEDDDMGQWKTSYVAASENMNFQEENMKQRKTSYVPFSENINFQEDDMEQWKSSYVHASENMNFQEGDIENMKFQEVDLGKKISQGSSSRNGRMETKGKYAAGSYPLHFRPMPADEKTQFESLSSQSFPPMVSVSSHKNMYSSTGLISSDNLNFQEEDKGQKKTSHDIDFQVENVGKKSTSYVQASETVSFQEEDHMRKKKTSAMNFQEVDLGRMVSKVSSSRNGRMETKRKHGIAVSHPSRLKPEAVDDETTQFNSLSSRSFSIQMSKCSSLDSSSSENMNSVKEDSGEKKSSQGSSSSSSSSSSSPSPPARTNGETSFPPFHAHGFSAGSMPQDDMKSSNLIGDMEGLNLIGRKDPQCGNKYLGRHALQSESGKPVRGKSVRTRRSGGSNSEAMKMGEKSSKETDEKVERKPDNAESVLMRKEKVKSEEPDLLLKGNGKKILDSCPVPEVTFSNHHHKSDKLEAFNNVSKEELDFALENIQLSSDEDTISECVNDSGLDSEVDKKASEFIAKFKAHIRLQKMGSIERSKGQKTFGNNNIR